MKISIFTFDKTAQQDVLDLFGKAIDAEGFIVEKDNPEQRVLTPKGEEIHQKEWGGIHKGSKAFIKSDVNTLIELAKKL